MPEYHMKQARELTVAGKTGTEKTVYNLKVCKLNC